MQESIDPSTFTPASILKGQFVETFPEFYTLKTVMESQGWHDNQTAFDHSIECATALERIIQFDYLQPEERQQLLRYLYLNIETHSRLELLRLSVLLHDIGKLVSIQCNPEGNTTSPSHGIIGAWVAKPLVDRFDITEVEKQFVLDLISDHLVPSDLIEMAINNGSAHQEIIDLLRTNRPNSAIELSLLAYADWLGCDVRESVRKERDMRVEVVHECLSLLQ